MKPIFFPKLFSHAPFLAFRSSPFVPVVLSLAPSFLFSHTRKRSLVLLGVACGYDADIPQPARPRRVFFSKFRSLSEKSARFHRKEFGFNGPLSLSTYAGEFQRPFVPPFAELQVVIGALLARQSGAPVCVCVCVCVTRLFCSARTSGISPARSSPHRRVTTRILERFRNATPFSSKPNSAFNNKKTRSSWCVSEMRRVSAGGSLALSREATFPVHLWLKHHHDGGVNLRRPPHFLGHRTSFESHSGISLKESSLFRAGARSPTLGAAVLEKQRVTLGKKEKGGENG